MGRRYKSIIAVLLSALGIAALCGCIFIPGLGPKTQGKDMTGTVGLAGSHARIAVLKSTIDDVLLAFGPPGYAAYDGGCIAYSWTTCDGLWLGLCMGFELKYYALVLTFNDDGLLTDFEITTRYHTPVGWNSYSGPHVWDTRANRGELNKVGPDWMPPVRRPMTRSVQTLPTTVPARPSTDHVPTQ